MRSMILASVAFSAFALTGCGGCSQNQPTPAQQAEIATYAAELHACVQPAPGKTREDADACRARVEAKYAVDAGAR